MRSSRSLVLSLILWSSVALFAPACGPSSNPNGDGGSTSSWTTAVGPLKPILLSVWGTGPKDVWAVGGVHDTSSYVLHFDGTGWTEMKTPAPGILWWVYGFSPSDVWMVGEKGTIVHFDGKAFATVDSKAGAMDVLYGLWGATPGELWAVGGQPDTSSVVLHLANGQWTAAATAKGGTWFKVWGAAASDVYVVGQYGAMSHWDGAAFAKVDLSASGAGTQQPLLTISGNAPNNIYAVGGLGNGLAIHFDGTRWATVPGLVLDFSPGLMGVSVDRAGDVVMTGQSGAKYRGRDATWVDDGTRDPLADLHGCWAESADDLFAVGGNFASLKSGEVAHYGAAIAGLK